MPAALPLTILTTAQQDLVAANLLLVPWAIRKYAPHVRFGEQHHDLLTTDCMIALCRAAATFKPERGTFATHATWQLRSAISHYWTYLRGGKRRGRCILLPTVHDKGDTVPTLNPTDRREIRPERQAEARELLARCRRLLTAREWHILTMLYMWGWNLQAVAQRLDPPVTREAVRQIEAIAIQKLRRRFPEAVALFGGAPVPLRQKRKKVLA